MIEDYNLEDEIKSKYFLDYFDYSEVRLLENDNKECHRCGKKLEALTPLNNNFYTLPCWDCSDEINNDVLTEGLLKGIDKFYNEILGDRYYQMFFVDDTYIHSTFPHTYETFKRSVLSLSPPSRKDIWFLDFLPGYPHIISPQNIDGLKIVNITRLYGEPILEKDKIIVGDYKIYPPDLIDYRGKQFTRYSIYKSKDNSRKRKRLKVNSIYAARLYETPDPEVLSFFRVFKNDKPVDVKTISHQDFVVIKLAIMRNKDFMRLLFDAILETLKITEILKDTVFIKNTVKLTTDRKKSKNIFNLLWSYNSEYKINNIINISII